MTKSIHPPVGGRHAFGGHCSRERRRAARRDWTVVPVRYRGRGCGASGWGWEAGRWAFDVGGVLAGPLDSYPPLADNGSVHSLLRRPSSPVVSQDSSLTTTTAAYRRRWSTDPSRESSWLERAARERCAGGQEGVAREEVFG